MTARYEVRLWEKAEHWYFDVVVEAENETEARAKIRRDYPAKEYQVASGFYRVG